MEISSKGTYSLRQVVELTGVSEFTLRGWELRHQALAPKRSDSGRRLYSRSDLLRAKALFDITQRGHRIGSVAQLSNQKLEALLLDAKAPDDSSPSASVGRVIHLSHRLEWRKVSLFMETQLKRLGKKKFIFDLVLPLLEQIGMAVAEARLGLAEEHILSALIKEKLFTIRAGAKKGSGLLKYVFATPEGDYHEMGILVASTLVALKGDDVLYLGPNMPANNLCEACLRFGGTHIILASTLTKREGAKSDVLEYINFIDRQLDPKVALWVGGRNLPRVSLKLRRDFFELPSFLSLQAKLS